MSLQTQETNNQKLIYEEDLPVSFPKCGLFILLV